MRSVAMTGKLFTPVSGLTEKLVPVSVRNSFYKKTPLGKHSRDSVMAANSRLGFEDGLEIAASLVNHVLAVVAAVPLQQQIAASVQRRGISGDVRGTDH